MKPLGTIAITLIVICLMWVSLAGAGAWTDAPEKFQDKVIIGLDNDDDWKTNIRKMAGADEINDLIPRIVMAESSGNPHAISKANCRGLMQISEIVLREYNQCNGTSYLPNRLFDGTFNMNVGEWYLRRLKTHYIPPDKYSVELLLSCYNVGPTHMRKKDWDWMKAPEETLKYIQKVLK